MIDLNADLGEGFGIWKLGDDDALLDIVTSANVACGFHAGDPLTIRRTCAAAVDRGVAIGAQVSYRDLAGFGRREMDVDPQELHAEVLYQLAAVDGIARATGGRVSYVKPHGALYNRACRDEAQAEAVVAAVADYSRAPGPGYSRAPGPDFSRAPGTDYSRVPGPGETTEHRRTGMLPILTLPGSALQDVAARHGVPVLSEWFADRAYTASGALVSRREPGAVLDDPDEAAARAVRMARDGLVTAVDGTEITVSAQSICVHGDTPGAVRLARAVRNALLDAGITIKACT